MNRKLIAVLLSAAMLLTGCSGGKAQEEKTAGEESKITSDNDAAQQTDGAKAVESRETDKTDQEIMENEKPVPISLYAGLKFDGRMTDDDKYLMSVTYPEIRCEEETGFESLNAALEKVSSEMENEAKKTADDTEEWCRTEDAYPDFEEGMYYTYEKEFFLTRGDSKAVSFLTATSGYTGGAHGFYYYSAYNIDSQSGNVLKTVDILNDGEAEKLPDLLESAILEKNDKEMFIVEDISDAIKEGWEANGDICFTLDAAGVTF